MGLFSKLFSRENEPADKAQDGSEGKASADENEQSAQSEASAAEPAERHEKRAAAPTAKAEPAPPPTANHDPIEEQPTTRMTKDEALREMPAAAAARVQPEAAAQPAAPAKREDARVAPPPPASKGNGGAARAPAAAAPAAVKTAPLLKTPKAKGEPSKTETKTGMAAAARPSPAATQKAAPPPRAAGDETATAPKRPAKTTQRGFAPPIVASAPERVAAQPAPEPAAKAAAEVAAPAVQTATAQPIAEDVDAALDQLLDATAPNRRSSASDEAADRRAVAETFAAMIKVHAHPLRDFMFQLSLRRTPRQWAAACRPVVRPLLEGSQQIGADELAGALLAFDAALERASSETSAFIGEATAVALEQAYARMHGQMPDAFAPADQADGRRLVLLESLLLQVPALHRRTLDKLYAAGLTSLAQLSQAKPEEIAAVAGIDLELARAVVDQIQRFERERSRVDPSALRSHVCERMRAVVRRLEQLQLEFERAEQDESSERKRAARRGREAAVLELEVLFAELGDLDLVEELKRYPVRNKIRRIESYLERLPASA